MSPVLQSCPDLPEWLARHVRAIGDTAPPWAERPAVADRVAAIIAAIPDTLTTSPAVAA